MPEESPALPRSLYFRHSAYPFVRPSELDGPGPRHRVAIVGAGPVGLTIALDLARHGISSVVIERDRTVSAGSRAICIARRSLDILHPLGIAGRIAAKGLAWTSGRSFYRNREIYALEMPHGDDERYYPMTNLQQTYLEKYLVDAVSASETIELRWRSAVTGLAQQADGVVLTVATPAGEYRLAADYVIAADGARSTLRDLMGLRLSGESYEGCYLIADIRMHSAHATERRAWFDPPSNPGSTVLMHRQPDDIWRVDFQLTPEELREGDPPEAQVRRRIAAQLEMVGETQPWELDWYSLYHAHCLCLDDYLHGRVLYAGDAAHLVPIFGVRGLNSGFADATNLAWKLAYVLHGWAGAELLATYTLERRAATLEIFSQAGKSTQFMTPQTRGHRLLRDAVLSLSLSESFPRPLVSPRQSEPYDYVNSPLNCIASDEPASGTRPGAPMPNVRLGANDYLLDHLGVGFTAFCFDAASTPLEPRVGTSFPLGVGDEPLTIVRVDSAHARSTCGADHGAVFLVRPDGHLCARWSAWRADRVAQALATAVPA